MLSSTATSPAVSRPGSDGASLALCHVIEPCGHEREGVLSTGEGADYTRAPVGLPARALDGDAGPDPPPVLAREPRVRQGLGLSVSDGPGNLPEPHPVELGGSFERRCIG